MTVTPAQTTTYTVTGTNASGCTGTATVTVTVNALPIVTLTLPTSTLCLTAAPLTLSGGTPAGGTYSGVGVSNGVFSATSAGPGTYTITYTVSNAQGCTASATQQLTVTTTACPVTATMGTAPVAELALYPNPTTGLITVSLTGASRAAVSGIVLNALGQQVGRFALPASGTGPLSQTVDLHELPSGVYLLRLDLGGGHWLTRRLVLNH